MININLLSPELKAKRIKNKKNASLVSICFVVIIIFIVLGIVAKSFESTIKTNLETSKSNLEKNNVLAEKDKNIQNQVIFINDRWQSTKEIGESRVIWSQMLQDLMSRVPLDVQLENLTANTEKTPNFILQGNTVNEREIIKFKEKLENSAFFKNVSFKSSSVQKGEGSDPTAGGDRLKFTLEFDLENNSLEPTATTSPSEKSIN